MTERIVFLFALFLVGFLLRRIRLFGSAGMMDLVRLNMDFLLPALIFITSATRLTPKVAALSSGFAGPLLGLPLTALLVVGTGLALGYLTVRVSGTPRKSRGTYVYILTLANAAFLPVPLSYALWGEDGILYVSLYMLGYTPMMWSLGVWILRGRINVRWLFHPILIALIAGAAFGLSGTPLPEPLVNLLKLVGNSSIPLALIYSGAILAEQKMALGRDLKPMIWVAAIKLVAVPAVAVAALRMWDIPQPMATQSVLQAAMPCMAQAGLYVARIGGDTGLASKASLVTTALSVLTVPFFLSLAG